MSRFCKSVSPQIGIDTKLSRVYHESVTRLKSEPRQLDKTEIG